MSLQASNNNTAGTFATAPTLPLNQKETPWPREETVAADDDIQVLEPPNKKKKKSNPKKKDEGEKVRSNTRWDNDWDADNSRTARKILVHEFLLKPGWYAWFNKHKAAAYKEKFYVEITTKLKELGCKPQAPSSIDGQVSTQEFSSCQTLSHPSKSD